MSETWELFTLLTHHLVYYITLYIYFILKYRVPPPLAHLYKWKEDNFWQSIHIWDKSKVLWRTCWGTYWELERKIVKSHQEPGKNEKNPHSPLPKLKREKKERHLECFLGPSHWLHEISLPNRVPHYFWPGLIPLANNTMPIGVLNLFHIN